MGKRIAWKDAKCLKPICLNKTVMVRIQIKKTADYQHSYQWRGIRRSLCAYYHLENGVWVLFNFVRVSQYSQVHLVWYAYQPESLRFFWAANPMNKTTRSSMGPGHASIGETIYRTMRTRIMPFIILFIFISSLSNCVQQCVEVNVAAGEAVYSTNSEKENAFIT